MLKTGRRGFMKWAGAVALTIAIDPKFGSEWGAVPPKVVTPKRKGDDELMLHVLKNRDAPTGFQRIEFPAVRRVFPQMISSDIVSVQPMTLPSSALFYETGSYSYQKAREADVVVAIAPHAPAETIHIDFHVHRRPWWKRWLRVA